MARKPVSEVELVEELGEHTPADDDTLSVEDNILAAVDATDKNVTWDIRIYKLDKTAGNAEEYMFSILPAELDGLYDRVRDMEGTGTYRMKAYRQIGTGRKVVFKAKDFRIRATQKPTQQQERPSEMTAVLAAMKEQSERMERFMRDVLATRPATPEPARANPLQDMAAMAAILKGLRDDNPAKPATQQPDLTSVFVKGVEFAEKIVGDKGGSEPAGIWDIAKEVIRSLPSMAAIAANQPRRVAPPARPAQIKQTPAAPPANAPPAPAQQPQMSDMQATAQELLQYLVTRAQRNSDAAFYADWVIENVDGEVIAWVLAQPDPIAAATLLEPRVANYRTWFTECIAEVRQVVNMQRSNAEAQTDAARQGAASDVPHDDPGRSAGNGSDAANHVPLGQGWKKAPVHS